MGGREVYLVSRSHILLGPVKMNTAGNFGRLLLQGDQQVTGVVIKACEGQGVEKPSTTALITHYQCLRISGGLVTNALLVLDKKNLSQFITCSFMM